jgi:rsbT co-antagonist protein RsbR
MTNDAQTIAELQTENERLRQRITALEQHTNNQHSSNGVTELFALSLFDDFPLPIQIYRLDGIMLTMNRASEEYWQTSRQAVAGTFSILHDAQLQNQGISSLFKRALSGKTVITPPHFLDTAHMDIEHIQDRQNWIVSTFFPLYDQAGTLRYIGVINRDVATEVEQVQDLQEEQQHSNADLQQQQNLLWGVVDGIPAAVIVKDTQGRYLMINRYAAETRQQSPEALLGKTDDEIFPPAVAQAAKGSEQQVLASGQAIEREITMPSANGNLTLLATSFPIRDTQGAIIAVGGMGIDITERKQAEDNLRIFQTLVENAPDGISIVGLDGKMTYANPAFRQMSGYGDAVIGMQMHDFRPQSGDTDVPLIMQTLREQGIWQGRQIYQRKDSSTFAANVSAFMIYDEEGNPITLMGIHRDITEQERQAQELQTFKMLVDNASDAIAIVNTNTGLITYHNETYRQMYRCDSQVGQPISVIVAPEDKDQLPGILEQIVERGQWKGQLLHIREDGSTFPALESCFVIRDDAGDVQSIVGIVRDISEQVQAEAERAALQQQIINAQRDALSELSTPLIPISESVVIMPLLGTIDSQRAQMVMETLLEGVAQHRATLAILDITGVPVVDTQVAQALISAARAVRLLGAQVMLTGIQPQIAQTLVHLGVDLSGINTRGSLQAGIAAALTKRQYT